MKRISLVVFLRAAGLLALVASSPADAFIRGANTTSSALGWTEPGIVTSSSPMPKMGPGGNLTGIDIATDGTMVVKADVYGGFWWNPNLPGLGNAGGTGSWVQLLTLSSMPSAYLSLGAGFGSGTGSATGIMEIVIANSNTSRFYMMYVGRMFRTDDHGATWTYLSAFGQATDGGGNPPPANGPGPSAGGKYIAVHPTNPDEFYITTFYGVLKKSTDAGASFSTVSGVGTVSNVNSSIGHLIAYDPSNTNNVYVHTAGQGLYFSNNGGASFSAVTGGPTDHIRLVVAPNGTVWMSSWEGTPSYWKYTGGAAGTWTQYSSVTITGGGNPTGIAIDPTNSSKVLVIDAAGPSNTTTNAGSSWVGTRACPLYAATDVPWLGWTNSCNSTVTAWQFDPSQSNVIMAATGIGAFKQTAVFTTAQPTMTSVNSGLEELVGGELVWPPGGSLYSAVWDRSGFLLNLSTYPSVHAPNATDVGAEAIILGSSADYVTSSPSTIVSLMQGSSDYSGISTNNGSSFTDFGNKSPSTGGLFYGSIAGTTASKLVWFPASGFVGSGNRPYFSTNDGASWSLATFPAGIPTSGTTGWGYAFSLSRGVTRCVAADRDPANPNTLYAWNWSTAASGLYRSTDDGQTWTLRSSSPVLNTGVSLSALQGVLSYLKTPPSLPGSVSTAGHVYYSAVQNTVPFMKSTDGGQTFTSIGNFTLVVAYGFGAIYPGQNYPAILVAGIRSSTWGLWQSIDGGTTWTNETRNYKSGDVFIDIVGDPSTPGRWVISRSGSGLAYGRLN